MQEAEIKMKLTYCHEKLPVIPSLSRSRNERCRFGPEELTGGITLARGDVKLDDVILLNMDKGVGLPVADAATCCGGCVDAL